MAGVLRPTPTYRCPYGEAEARERIVRFFHPSSFGLDVATVARVFGVPEMVTAYDDPRLADYRVRISGEGGWSMRLSVREGFYPLNALPPKFVPGLRPKRLDRFENSDRSVDLDFKIASVKGRTLADCEHLFSFVAAARQAGWGDDPLPMLPLDGGPMYPTLVAAGGRHFTVAPQINAGDECAVGLFFSEGAKRKMDR